MVRPVLATHDRREGKHVGGEVDSVHAWHAIRSAWARRKTSRAFLREMTSAHRVPSDAYADVYAQRAFGCLFLAYVGTDWLP